MPRFTYLPHLALTLPDPELAAVFYVRVMGFHIEGRQPDEIEIALDDLHLHLERGPAPTTPLWFAFETDDLEAAIEDLTEAGCRVSTAAAELPDGGVLVRDPFGLGLYITPRQVGPESA